jgi:Zn-dependent peptidase ImmA (M78 family)
LASLKQNVARLLKVRGLSERELGSRIGKTSDELHQWLEEPPKRKETVVKKIASELLVPDFFLFAESPLLPASSIADFRLSTPALRPYQRDTLKAIDLAKSIQADPLVRAVFKPERRLSNLFSASQGPRAAAEHFRKLIHLTDKTQANFDEARHLYSYLRRGVEQFETFVFQFSFSTNDGVGFAVSGENTFDAIVVNTLGQNYPRRLFTLAHEIYHCILNETGISDPDVLKNNIERQCNTFAVELLSPASLVASAAERTITSSKFEISELRAFAKIVKLSLHASVLRLVETRHYSQTAIGAWLAFIRSSGNPDLKKRGGGGKNRQPEWKYKVSRFGTRLAEVYRPAIHAGIIDDLDFYRLSGIKPKYQSDYFENAPTATLSDEVDEPDA